MIQLVPLWRIDDVWPMFSDGFAKAFERGGSNRTLIDTYRALRCSALFLHVIYHDNQADAGVIMDVTDDILKVIAIAKVPSGRRGMQAWMGELLAYDWPRTVGVKRIRFEGRDGWERAVPGVRVVRQVYEMELS